MFKSDVGAGATTYAMNASKGDIYETPLAMRKGDVFLSVENLEYGLKPTC